LSVVSPAGRAAILSILSILASPGLQATRRIVTLCERRADALRHGAMRFRSVLHAVACFRSAAQPIPIWHTTIHNATHSLRLHDRRGECEFLSFVPLSLSISLRLMRGSDADECVLLFRRDRRADEITFRYQARQFADSAFRTLTVTCGHRSTDSEVPAQSANT
jgi:hypothetical protein